MKKIILLTSFVSVAFTGFCTNNADSASYHVKQANELTQSHKFWDADKSYAKAVAFAPTNAQIRIEYGNFLMEQRKTNFAIAQFAKVLEKDINNEVALLKMAEISFQFQRWSEAVAFGGRLIDNPNMKGIKYMLGKSYYEMENFGQAQRFLSAAVAENPKNIKAVSLLGKVYIDLSNYKQAINVYNQTLQLDPNNNQLIYELGLLYYTLNDEKSAVKYFEQAMDKGYKADLGFLENLGMAYLSQDIKKGISILEQVLDKKPNNPEILFQIGQAYYKAEKFEDAARTYFRVYSSDPSNSRALYMTGVAYQKKGDKQKGIALCEQAIAQDPNLALLKSQKFSF